MYSNRFFTRWPRSAGVVLAAAVLAACGHSSAPPKKEAETAPVQVRVVTATLAAAPAFDEVSGTVRAQTESAVSSRVMAYVREVRAAAGDRVRAGQTLVILDQRELDSAHRQAEAAVREAKSGLAEASVGVENARAQLELARATFKRMKDLFDKNSVSNQEFDEATARLRAAEAVERSAVSRRTQMEEKIKQAEEGVAAAGIQRGYAEIRAPFEGRVLERKVEPGNMATPGAPLLTIERDGVYRLEAPVEESRVRDIQRGHRVAIALEALNTSVEGTVAEIVPAVDPASRSFLVKINLPAVAGLRSGLFGKARFAAGSRQALTVPAAVVTTQGQVQTVLVADKGYARARLVTTGAAADGRIEILSGLAEGDAIVFPRVPGLGDGARVEVR
jgi:membrane fusion protein, multidrug efflux system